MLTATMLVKRKKNQACKILQSELTRKQKARNQACKNGKSKQANCKKGCYKTIKKAGNQIAGNEPDKKPKTQATTL